MEIKSILKKKYILFMATSLLKKEENRMSEEARKGSDTIKNLYFTSKLSQEPYRVVGGKIVWSEEESLALEYQKQVYEIERLNKNIKKLTNLLSSTKISSYTKNIVKQQIALLEKATKVYAEGKDNQEFDQRVSDINDFTSEHLVIRKGHKTFRIAKSREYEVKFYGYDMIANHRLARLKEASERFDRMATKEKTK